MGGDGDAVVADKRHGRGEESAWRLHMLSRPELEKRKPTLALLRGRRGKGNCLQEERKACARRRRDISRCCMASELEVLACFCEARRAEDCTSEAPSTQWKDYRHRSTAHNAPSRCDSLGDPRALLGAKACRADPFDTAHQHHSDKRLIRARAGTAGLSEPVGGASSLTRHVQWPIRFSQD